MNDLSHSPTPWEMYEDSGLCEYDVRDATGALIFSLPMSVDDDDEIDPVDDANAAFVLKAVNSHATLTADLARAVSDRAVLLKALEGCIAFRNWQLAEGGVTPAELVGTFKRAEEAIRQAIIATT